MKYVDVDLEVGLDAGDRLSSRIFDSPVGASELLTSEFRVPPDLTSFLSGVDRFAAAPEELAADGRPGREHLRSIGLELFRATLAGWGKLAWARDEADERESGLRIRIHPTDARVAALPWELLYDPEDREYFALDSRSSLTRRVPRPGVPEPLEATHPLRVLACASVPVDLTQIAAQADVDSMQRVASESSGRLVVQQIRPEIRELERALLREGPWHVFHFSGHGDFQSASGGALAFERPDRRRDLVDAATVARMLGDQTELRLAVLSACRGGMSDGRMLIPSTAASIIHADTPAVVAMHFYVGDSAAVEFTRGFYERLALDGDVEDAVHGGRRAMAGLQLYERPDQPALEALRSMEWCSPVLHLNSLSGVLFTPEKVSASAGREAVAATGAVNKTGRLEWQLRATAGAPLPQVVMILREACAALDLRAIEDLGPTSFQAFVGGVLPGKIGSTEVLTVDVRPAGNDKTEFTVTSKPRGRVFLDQGRNERNVRQIARMLGITAVY